MPQTDFGLRVNDPLGAQTVKNTRRYSSGLRYGTSQRRERGTCLGSGGSDPRVEGSEPSCGLAGRVGGCAGAGKRAPPASQVESLEDQWGLVAWISALSSHPQI